MESRRKIRSLYRKCGSIKEVSRRTGISVPTVGSVASVREVYNFEQYDRIPDTLRHQIYKILERRMASRLADNLSFLNHANVFNS